MHSEFQSQQPPIHSEFQAKEPPPPMHLEFQNATRGKGTDIFWNYPFKEILRIEQVSILYIVSN